LSRRGGCLDVSKRAFLTEALEGLEDGPVAGAPAEIPVEMLLDLGLRWGRSSSAGEEGVGIHNPSGGAEPTLGAVGFGEALLYRVGVFGGANAFNCDDSLAMDGVEVSEAGVHSHGLPPFSCLACWTRDGDGAGAAATLSATYLCPCQTCVRQRTTSDASVNV